LTPVIKACLTDLGFEAANLGVQIYGGHGYIRDNGMEQLVRDSRIAQIYEGTNGIQALDLVGRKMSTHCGRLLRRLFHPLAQFLADSGSNLQLQEFVAPLAKAFDRLQRATLKIAERGLRNPEEAGAAAYDYLRLLGLVAQGYMWARMARLALDVVDRNASDAEFYRSKIATARFFTQRVMPQSSSLFAAIMAGGRVITEIEERALCSKGGRRKPTAKEPYGPRRKEEWLAADFPQPSWATNLHRFVALHRDARARARVGPVVPE